MLSYKKITNFLKAAAISLNGTEELSPISEMVREKTKTMIR